MTIPNVSNIDIQTGNKTCLRTWVQQQLQNLSSNTFPAWLNTYILTLKRQLAVVQLLKEHVQLLTHRSSEDDSLTEVNYLKK